MKRFLAIFLAVAALATSNPAHAQNVTPDTWGWNIMTTRSTGTSGQVTNPSNWVMQGGRFSLAFLDSSVMRVGTWAQSVVDTSIAYSIDDFPFPPTLLSRNALDGANYLHIHTNTDPSQHGPSGTDSLITFQPDTLDNTRWIAVRITQDSTSLAFSGACGFDSLKVAAQTSDDGVNWFSVSGTPTRLHDATYLTVNPIDGLVPFALAAGEQTPGHDRAEISCECQPSIYTDNAALILNRTLCMASRFIRFIIALPGASGQFKAEIGRWSKHGGDLD